MTSIQLDIIRTFGSKELSEGVIIQRMGNYYKSIQGRHFINLQDGKYLKSTTSPIETIPCEILGHIPHLFPDVARVAKDNLFIFEVGTKQIYIQTGGPFGGKYIPYNPTLPLIDQDESTLTQLLKLFNE